MEFLGTRLEPAQNPKSILDKKRKGIPVHLQQVRDDQGRQRLHGAFQGGFSAGYFNTAGSKEGWQPKRFKSGRSGQKDSIEQMNAFDFMDADDIQEFGAGVLKNQYAEIGSTEQDLKRKKAINDMREDGIYGNKMIPDLIIPIKTKMGDRLYERMKPRSGKIVNDGEETLRKLLSLKENQMAGVVTYGRGFDPLSCAPEFEKVKLDSNDEKKESEKSLEPKSLRKTRGFGTGIFDDEDDEDYDIHVPSNFNKYIGEDEEQEDAFMKKYELKIEKKSPKIITTATTNQRKGGLLEGFHLQINSTYTQPKFFVAPYPPGNWTPLPTFLSPAYISEKANQEKEEGEKMKTQSIFSYLNSKNKERLEAFISQASTTSISTSNLPKKEAQAPLPIYSVPIKVAEAALKGFMPFGNDLPKQARYKTFLEDIISKSKNEEPLQDSLKKLSNDEANETREFSKAAMIYRPLSNMISSRFSNETGLDVKSEKEELPPVKVVRTIGKWKPSKLMCKRFGVAHHDDNDEEPDKSILAESKQALNPETMKSLIEERDKLLQQGEISANLEDITPSHSEVKKDDLLEEFMDEAIGQKEEGVDAGLDDLGEKPSMDLFKAIFAEDSSSDHEDEESADQVLATKSDSEVKSSTLQSLQIEVKKVVEMKPNPQAFTVPRPPPSISASSSIQKEVNEVKDEKRDKNEEEQDLVASFFASRRKAIIPQSQSQNQIYGSVSKEPFTTSTTKSVGSTQEKKISGVVVGSRKKKTAIRVVSYDDEEEDEDEDLSLKKITSKRRAAADFM